MEKHNKYLIKNIKYPLEIEEVKLTDLDVILSPTAHIFQVSNVGIKFYLNREDLPNKWRSFLSLQFLLNKNISVYLSEMDFRLEGYIFNIDPLNSDRFKVFVRFHTNAPDYWKNCLFDTLKAYPEGEFSSLHFSSS